MFKVEQQNSDVVCTTEHWFCRSLIVKKYILTKTVLILYSTLLGLRTGLVFMNPIATNQIFGKFTNILTYYIEISFSLNIQRPKQRISNWVTRSIRVSSERT